MATTRVNNSLVISVKQLVRERAKTLQETQEVFSRPQTRADCKDGERPCPYVSCRYHLYLDVTEAGSIKLNFPDITSEDFELLPQTCALDVADAGGVSLEDVGNVLNLTRERVRQIEVEALEILQRRVDGL